MIVDKEMGWKREQFFFASAQWQGSIATTSLIPTEVGALDYGVQQFGTSGVAIATKVEGKLWLPPHWDPNFALGMRLIWSTGSTTAADTITWTVLQNVISLGSAIAAATGALNTTIAVGILGTTTANQMQVTSRGIRNAGWATRAQLTTGAMLQFSVDVTATDIDAGEKVWVYGMIFDYMPCRTVYPHREFDAPLDDQLA